MKYLKAISQIIKVICLLIPIGVMAQPISNSPYSRFGLGDIQDRNINYLESMGALGASYNNPYYINIANPASYSFIKATAFDIGVHTRRSSFQEGENPNINVWSGNLSYISLAFPLQNYISDALERLERDVNFAMGLTLMPYSTVGYNVSSEITAEESPETGAFERNYQGSGGTYQMLHGTSVNYKGLSVGLQMGYLFGNIEYQRNVFFPNLVGAYNNFFKTSYNVRGFVWNGGMMYSKVLNQKEIDKNKGTQPMRFTFGLHGNSNTSFTTESDLVEESIQNVLGASGRRDTLNSYVDSLGKGTIPSELGVGFNFQSGEKFALGVNYSLTNWSKYTNDAQPETLINTYKVSFGGFFRPDYKSYNNFFARNIYRFGAFYKTEPQTIAAEKIDNYGLNFGLGIPFIRQRKVSHANLGFTIGRRGSQTNITENYLRFTFGFTFNDDEWFIKRKYN